MTTKYITLVFHTPDDIVLAEVGELRYPNVPNQTGEMSGLMLSHGASRVVILDAETLAVIEDQRAE